jgi:hypothetical protein
MVYGLRERGAAACWARGSGIAVWSMCLQF